MDNACNVDNGKHIPITITNNYSLRQDLFNPIQNSPPSIWKSRLLHRISNNKLNNILNKNYKMTSLTLIDIN